MKKRLNLFVFALIAILAVSSISIPMIQAGGAATDQGSETPAETPAEETPAETPAEETPAETPAEETPAETPAEETPAETPAEETPAETPAEETPAETPAEETPAETPAEETPAETPAEETPAETPAEETPAETPAEETPAETPAEETPAETPTEETPAETTKPTETKPEPKYVNLKSVDKNGKENGLATTSALEGSSLVVTQLEAPAKKGKLTYAYEINLLDKDKKIGDRINHIHLNLPSDIQSHNRSNLAVFRLLANGKEKRVSLLLDDRNKERISLYSFEPGVYRIEAVAEPQFEGEEKLEPIYYYPSYNKDKKELNSPGFVSAGFVYIPTKRFNHPFRFIAYEVEAKAPANQVSVAYEMHFLDYEGKKIDYAADDNVKVRVAIWVPEKLQDYAAKDLTLYHVLADGKEEKVDFIVSKDGKTIRFDTNSFSVYRLAATKEAEIPETGESSFAYYLAAFGFLLLASFLLVKRIKIKN